MGGVELLGDGLGVCEPGCRRHWHDHSAAIFVAVAPKLLLDLVELLAGIGIVGRAAPRGSRAKLTLQIAHEYRQHVEELADVCGC